MKCTNCGSDFASDQLKCPYCGTVNEHALKLAKELQGYDAEYEKKRDDLLKNGTTQVLKRITAGLGITFLIITLLFGGYVLFFQYRFSEHSTYEVTGSRLTKNKELIARYLEEEKYVRAYITAAKTDPTGEHFEYYPEYADDLTTIYNYSIVLVDVMQSMDKMDDGDNYPGLRSTDLISVDIFYHSADSAVKKELEREIDSYLKNYYRLTKDEIEALKALEPGEQFTLDGNADIEAVTKQRMVEYFGK